MQDYSYKQMYEQEGSFWWYIGLHELIIDIIKQHLHSKEQKIIDIGCGTGKLIEKLKEYGNCEGIDISETAIDYCHQRGLTNVSKKDINIWQSKKEYDIITCIDVLYHQWIEDENKILKEFHSALSSTGKLIIEVPAFKQLERHHDKLVMTKKRFTKKELIISLSNAGFSINTVSYRLPLVFFLIIIQKLFKKNHHKEESKDLKSVPKLINTILINMVRFENFLIRKKISLPFGSSLIIICDKKQ